MSDQEPQAPTNNFLKESGYDQNGNKIPSKETSISNVIPKSLEELRQQVTEKDIFWAKHKQERLIENTRELIPHSSVPSEDRDTLDYEDKDESIYGLAYNYNFSQAISFNQWKVGGGLSLEQAGILKVTNPSSNSLEYEKNNSNPSDWEAAKELVLNNSYFKRHQEFGDALEKIDVTKPDTYPLDLYLDLNRDEDKTIFKIYNGSNITFQETDFGLQPILDLSKPPSNEFLFTETSVQLFTAFEDAGLEFSQKLKDELVNRNKKRYGNSYVTLGREVAKLVSDNNRDLSKFFLIKENDDEVWQKINSLEIPSDPAAAILINTLKQINRQHQQLSDLPVSKEKVSFSAGTCKDLETYFSQSANEYSESVIEINGKKYLKEGSHHVDVNHMMINLEPIVFNGIVLPIGNLFRDSDNKDGFCYMRPTAFCFDQDYANQIFGEEYRESINSYGPPNRIFEMMTRSRNN